MSQWKRGAHGNTYGGNPMACAAANATLDLVRGGLVDNAASVGAHFMARLQELARDYPCIGEVRGKGLMIGMELIEGDDGQDAGARAVRRGDHPRLPQRPAAALLRSEHGALHAAA